MPTAEIIAIGTELLLGETADTNTRALARVLRSLGIDLYRTQTIGDNATRITETVRQAMERADIVITTGGLGPTVDDPTRQAIADSVDVPLEFHPELWKQITERIARYGRTPTENQKRQAYIPKNAVIIENPVGTAPAFIVRASKSQETGNNSELKEKIIISLPGVPREMETLMTSAIIPYLQKHFNLHTILKIRTLHVSGLGEGMIDDKIGDLETLANPTVGLTAHSGVVDIRIAAKGESDSEVGSMIAAIETDLRARLGDNILGTDEDTLESVTLEAVAKQGWTLACFEINLQGALLKRFAQTGDPAYLGGRILEVATESLADGTKAAQGEFKTSSAVGVSYTQEDEKQDIHIFLITPQGEIEHALTYGGHPGNARRWAVNMALDFLRRNARGGG
jgi:competence/damage-inducible protein CinA-like protein